MAKDSGTLKPIYSVPDGSNPMNEVCKCGALKQYHAEAVTCDLGDYLVAEPHSGACVRTGCKEFTFERFVVKPRPKK